MLSKRLASFKYAFKGILNLFQSQPNAQIHLTIGTLAIVLGLFLKLNFEEWAIL